MNWLKTFYEKYKNYMIVDAIMYIVTLLAIMITAVVVTLFW